MSVRRLAKASVQPASFVFNKAFTAQAKTWIRKYPLGHEQSAIIPLLMLAQEQDGWVTKAAIEHIADMLDMPYIRALEVATFYTQFQLKPVGTRAHIQVCGTTPCMLRGSEELMDVCRLKIHRSQFCTNETGTLSWEEVECLGACVNAPMMMIFKDTYEDLTPKRFTEIIDLFDAGNGYQVQPGSQTGRHLSAPITGFTTLKDEKSILKTTRDKAVQATTKTAKAAVVAEVVLAAAVTAPAEVAKKTKATSANKDDTSAKPSLEDRNRPAGIVMPAKIDNLKLISGVGPKIEGILHELGIFTFAQVARWKKAERGWVDGYLNFNGCIERDDWVKQAKALAKGGVAEYIRVFNKKPV